MFKEKITTLESTSTLMYNQVSSLEFKLSAAQGSLDDAKRQLAKQEKGYSSSFLWIGLGIVVPLAVFWLKRK